MGAMTGAGIGVEINVGNKKTVVVAVTVCVGVGDCVGDAVLVGVRVGVFDGGRVGVTMTTSAGAVTNCSGEVISLKVGVAENSGVALRGSGVREGVTVGGGVVGPSVFSANRRGPSSGRPPVHAASPTIIKREMANLSMESQTDEFCLCP